MRITAAAWLLLALALPAPAETPPPELEVFAGAAAVRPLEAAGRRFRELTGTRVVFHFGGSGAVLGQMLLARRGDLYAPGSSDFMELAKEKRAVDGATEARIAYLLPTINVARGNPRGIRSLSDLARRGLRVGIGRPSSVCVGLYGAEALERAGLASTVRPNLVGYAESCEKVAQMLSLGLVDAVLGWDVFARWDPQHVENVFLRPEQVPRIGYLPVAVSAFTRQRHAALAFVRFLAGPEGKRLYAAHGYATEADALRSRAKPATPVGGRWPLPSSWK